MIPTWARTTGRAAALSFVFNTGTIRDTKQGVVPTFTRATIKTSVDFEGYLKALLSGEVPFDGLRRVRNEVVNSETLTAVAGWFLANATSVVGAADPLGGTTAYTMTATSASATLGRFVSLITDASSIYVGSVYLRRRAGSGTIVLGKPDNAAIDITSQVTSSWQRFATPATLALVNEVDIRVLLGTSGDAVDVWHPQLERVVGQTNTNPSEYVSVGVLSTPFHGANVDGVKYFATLNGNTVVSNVVTEATGAALVLNGSGPGQAWPVMGYWPEPASTNVVLQSENFGTTWVAGGGVTRTAAALRCGVVVLDLLNDDSGVLEVYAQAVTFTGNGVKAVSFFFAKGTATSSVVELWDTTAGAARLRAVVTWTGAVPTITCPTNGTVLGIDTLGNGVFRGRVATSAVTAANVNTLSVYPASTNALAAADVGTFYCGGVQAENTPTCHSYIPTTTVTVTVNKDEMLVSGLGAWYNAAAGTLISSFVTNPDLIAGLTAEFNNGTAGTALFQYMNGPSPSFGVYVGGVAQATLNSGAVLGKTAHKWATAWSANDFASCVDAGSVLTDVAGAVPTVTRLEIGMETSGAQFGGGIRSLDYYASRLPDATLQLLSA